MAGNTTRFMRKPVTAAALAVLVLAGACSGRSSQSTTPENQPSAVATVALTNPTDFPLMSGANILDVKPFKQVISASSGRSSGLTAQGAGTYTGNEVLAGSTASASDVDKWLAVLEQKPPSGYDYEPETYTSAGQSLGKYGIQYAVFRNNAAGKKRAVVVVVMDPKLVKTKLGIAIDLVDKYRALPDYLRKPIDDQIKAKAGFSATEATDPSAPLGMTLAALKELQSKDERAIVMVDASKQ
jgi:hypothetical protein